MDSAIGFLLCLIFLGVVVFGVGVAYRNRAAISRWLNSPYYAADDRRLKLRRRIEDSEKELEALDEKELNAKNNEGDKS